MVLSLERLTKLQFLNNVRGGMLHISKNSFLQNFREEGGFHDLSILYRKIYSDHKMHQLDVMRIIFSQLLVVRHSLFGKITVRCEVSLINNGTFQICHKVLKETNFFRRRNNCSADFRHFVFQLFFQCCVDHAEAPCLGFFRTLFSSSHT